MDDHSDPTVDNGGGSNNKASIIGPVFPPPKLQTRSSASVDTSEDVTDVTNDTQISHDATAYGPALPPNQTFMGPVLPSWFNMEANDTNSSSSDDETIGPMPSSDVATGSAQRDIERRAEKMKDKLTNKGGSEELKREEWMTVLPPELSKNFGLGPRSFQRRTPKPTGDRSGWTDTPSERMEKEKASSSLMLDAAEADAEILAHSAQQKYDKDMEKMSEEHNNAKRPESLLVLHKKSLKRKGSEDKRKSKDRRPFDRDVDLKVNAMDDARRKALIKQSRQLNDKFSSGMSQFL